MPITNLCRLIQYRLAFPLGLLILFSVPLSSCGGGNSIKSPTPTAADNISSSPVLSDNPSSTKKTITQLVNGQQVERSYLIRTPVNATKDSYPIVFFFHGADDNGEDWLDRNTQVSALIDSGEFIGIFPDAFQGNWNLDHTNGADDIEFVSLIVNDLQTIERYNNGLIHAVGIYTGASLVNKLAKQTSIFTSIAPILSQQVLSLGEVVPTDPVSVFQVNTSQDNLVPINGGSGEGGTVFMSAKESADNWASSFNCTMEPISSSSRWSGYYIQKHTYSDCMDNKRVRYHIVEDADHSLLFSKNINLYKLIWIFFSYSDNSSPRNFKLLSLGDSYTIGQGVCVTCNFPEQLSSRLKDELPAQDSVELQIIAQTGWTTSDLKNAIRTAQLEQDYSLVSLLIGVNNQVQNKPSSVYETEFVELVNTAKSLANNNASKLIVLSIPDYGFTPFGQIFDPAEITLTLDAYNQFAEDYCQENGITYIYITDITQQGLVNTDLVASDNLHPSQLAYSMFVDRMMPFAIDKLH